MKEERGYGGLSISEKCWCLLSYMCPSVGIRCVERPLCFLVKFHLRARNSPSGMWNLFKTVFVGGIIQIIRASMHSGMRGVVSLFLVAIRHGLRMELWG